MAYLYFLSHTTLNHRDGKKSYIPNQISCTHTFAWSPFGSATHKSPFEDTKSLFLIQVILFMEGKKMGVKSPWPFGGLVICSCF